MSVSLENLDQVEAIYHLAKQLDASALAVAAVTSFGRGAGIVGCSDVEHHVMHRINEILAPYSDDPLFYATRREREEAAEQDQINCGAGWRSFALNSNGTVRSCLFLADSKKFGNLDTQNYDDVFRQNAMKMFHDAPSPGGPECRGPQPNGDKHCRFLGTCIGCFAKAFRVSDTEYPECPWRAKYFPGMSLSAAEGIHGCGGKFDAIRV
jgi:radical SAM protein with 4Fe4S-binding SPASM domain